MQQYIFNSIKRNNYIEISKALSLLYDNDKPVIVCIGSDLVVGDSLGPYVGTMLNEKLKGKAFVYGSLNSPITAKEVSVIERDIKNLHPNSKIIVIDAAVGNSYEVGYVKILDKGIKPGLGVKKDLPRIGDVSIIGIVSDMENSSAFLTRFSLVYKLANDIVEGVIYMVENLYRYK